MTTKKLDPKYRVKTRKELDLMHWDSMSVQGAEKLLRDTDSAITQIHAARLDVGLRIAAKERQILKAWPTEKMQGMRYLEHDLNELRKEQAQYERLLAKGEAARAFISARLTKMAVTA